MTEEKYAHIAVLEPTKSRLDNMTPKSFTYDRMINALLDNWESLTKSGVKSGKSPQSNQTS